MRLSTMMLGVMTLAIFLATAGRWIASGGPLGFPCGACMSSLGGLEIVASSDHLLTNMSLTTDKSSAVLDLEGRSIVVRGGEVAVGGTTRCVIPAGSKQVKFAATGGVLRISADGKTIREIR
jgi:hypothetical protein